MPEAVEKLLATFDELSPAEKQAFAKAFQSRLRTFGPALAAHTPPDDEAMEEAAAEIFAMYDEEERRNGSVST